MRMRSVWFALVALVALAAGACGSDGGAYGEAADAAQAQRTVDVTITQAKQYEPASITVAPGEVVKFRVTNAASELHEFMLGDEKTHEEHDGEMADMPKESMKMADRSNLLGLDPGKTKELTWKFPDEVGATVIYGSHVPGDYTGGLRGTITVGG